MAILRISTGVQGEAELESLAREVAGVSNGGTLMDKPAESAIKDPPRTLWGILKSVGPGLILTANIVGTGELIATTRLGSQVGFTLLWFIIFSCFIKVFVQVELGRYTISEGVGSLDAMNRLPGPRLRGVSWIIWMWVFMYMGTLSQMSGMVGGCAELFASRDQRLLNTFCAVGTAVSCAVLLAVGRYALVEKLSTFMVVLFTLTNLVAVGFLQTTAFRFSAAEVRQGLSFHLPESLLTAFGVFGITGVGAAELIFYPIWCLEKGYARSVGPRADTPEWNERARGWLRVMKYDAWLSMVVYTVATISFYLLGASILHRQGKTVGDTNTTETLSIMYTASLGSWGIWVFYIGAFMVLFSTLFVSTASNSRLGVDASMMMGLIKYRGPEERMKLVRWGVVIIPVAVLLVYLTVGKIVTLVLVGATAQAIMLPFLGFAAIYFHHKRIPEGLRPGKAWTGFLWASFLAMTAVGIFQAGKETGLWKAAGLVK